METEAEAILHAGMTMAEPKVCPGHRPFAVLPSENGMRIEYLERESVPDHVTACPKFDDSGSLIAYFKEFNDGAGKLFADIDACSVSAIIDYHEGPKGDNLTVTDWCQHRAAYQAKHSEEWKTWTAKNGRQMSQVEFAQFIEDNLIDISRPDGATVLEVALSIEASKSGSFKSARRLDNGNLSFGYVEETTAKAGTKNDIEIPKEFDVQLRPFLGCAHHKVTARLRYRIQDAALSLWFELVRHEDVKRLAFDAIVEKVADETGVKVLLGRA